MVEQEEGEPRYSLGAVVRLTGVGEHTLRAWERRYGAIRPTRTAGGTRRYSGADVARLRLLREAVECGHRISELAPHDDAALERLLGTRDAASPTPFVAQVCGAVDRLDLAEAERLLTMQFSAVGPVAFAREVAVPVLQEIGSRWQAGHTSIASEHLLSSVTRNILGIALQGQQTSTYSPAVVFTTPAGERHELGTLIAAVTAVGAGAAVTYLGPELPVEEVVRASAALGAAAVALGVVTLEPDRAEAYLGRLRGHLPPTVEIWVGGPGTDRIHADVPHLDLDLDGLVDRIGELRRDSDPN